MENLKVVITLLSFDLHNMFYSNGIGITLSDCCVDQKTLSMASNELILNSFDLIDN